MPASVGESFERKIVTLERWDKEGIPSGAFVPKNVTALAAWDDPDLGVTAWTSPKIVSPGYKYSDLRLRFDRVLPKLLAAAPTPQPEDIRQIKRDRVALAEQIVRLRLAFTRQERATERQRQLKVQEIEKNKALTRKLSGLVHFPRDVD
jgi:hypothetical protein